MKSLKRIGLIGRFRPLHNGGAALLENICDTAEHVVIGIGSVNKYNYRNPFTPEETKAMIERQLWPRQNYEIKMIPDFAHHPEYSDGEMWKGFIQQTFGTLDAFISGNEYVRDLLGDTYAVKHPWLFVPKEQQLDIGGTQVRVAMATGEEWRQLVPKRVAQYLDEHGLVERFRTEFGDEQLDKAPLQPTSLYRPEAREQEKLYTMGG